MTSFPLKIVTPDGLKFDGVAEELIVRSITGDFGILAGHVNCVVPLGMGQAMAIIDGNKKYAACIGGMLSVIDGRAILVPTSFEWADQIDVARAQASLDRANAELAKPNLDAVTRQVYAARHNRAQVRLNVAKNVR